MATLSVGQFVKAADNQLGIGKVLEVDEEWVTVEYFDSPTSDDRPTRVVPIQVINPVELQQETRVYFRHPATGHWFIGRSLIKSGSDYRVQFPNRKVGELPESAIYVRWDRPIGDPTDHLAQRVNETPYFHAGRAPFRASLVEQRAGCAGMTGLFSSVIELEEHQIEVVKRVLEDPIQRYLLADEVGLGKTIEAGAIMRQYALDRRDDFQILVVVPEHLIDQWEEELRTRFLFDQELDERVHVVAHGDTEEILTLGFESGMVVIDEAHQVAYHAHSEVAEERAIYEAIASVTTVVDKCLLLSATPVLHNEAGYLAMLHLLDPELYDLNDLEGFKELIEDRHDVAELFYGVTEENEEEELRERLAALADHFPDDQELQERSQAVEEVLDKEEPEALELDEEISSLRTHISETYRLHRRILRTPHSDQTQWLLPGRAEPKVLEVEEPHQEAMEASLEAWRQAASEAIDEEASTEWGEQVMTFLERATGLPRGLVRAVNGRLMAIEEGREEPASFEGEVALLEAIQEAAKEADEAHHRLDALVDHLSSTDDKVVVFVGDEDEADRVSEWLEEEWGGELRRHESVRDPHAQWKEFLEEKSCRVLVCDHRAEEGLNLQGSQARIIHLDLPVSPNRIEQRIGRVDRYGTGQPVESAIFVPASSRWVDGLCALHRDGFSVFQRSISPLPYLVEKKMRQLAPALLHEGPKALREATQRLGGPDGEVAHELERVRAQHQLDALEHTETADDEFYDRLWDVDFDAEHLEEVAHQWIRNRLQFHRVRSEHDHDQILRYEYRTESTAKHPTLLPIRELLGRFAFAVDPRVNGFRSYPMSFHRRTACSNEVHVARIGEPFITAMVDYIRWDDRGTSFSMWRHVPRHEMAEDPSLFFRFDFLVEADVEPAVEALEGYDHITKEAMRLRADGLFPPIMQTVWVDGDGRRVEDEETLEHLEMPYDQEGTKRFGRDYNLNSERWEKVSKLFDEGEWAGLCHSVRDRAIDVLAEQVDLRERCDERADRAVRQAQTTIARLRTRLTQSGVDSREVAQLELEEALVTALEKGIREPAISLDAIGAIFLSQVDPFGE